MNEEKFSELEGKSIESFQTEGQREKEQKGWNRASSVCQTVSNDLA